MEGGTGAIGGMGAMTGAGGGAAVACKANHASLSSQPERRC